MLILRNFLKDNKSPHLKIHEHQRKSSDKKIWDKQLLQEMAKNRKLSRDWLDAEMALQQNVIKKQRRDAEEQEKIKNSISAKVTQIQELKKILKNCNLNSS